MPAIPITDTAGISGSIIRWNATVWRRFLGSIPNTRRWLGTRSTTVSGSDWMTRASADCEPFRRTRNSLTMASDSVSENLVLVVDAIDHGRLDLQLADTGMKLLDRNRVRPVVLHLQPELGSFDSKGGVFRHQHRLGAGIGQVQAASQQAMIGRGRIENRRKPPRGDAIEFDTEAASGREGHRAPATPVDLEAPSCSKRRSAARALVPTSSGRVFFRSSSSTTTIGNTTWCSSKRRVAEGSARRTHVSRTKVRATPAAPCKRAHSFTVSGSKLQASNCMRFRPDRTDDAYSGDGHIRNLDFTARRSNGVGAVCASSRGFNLWTWTWRALNGLR